MGPVSKTILVVEDDRAVARLLRDVLEGEGHRVLVETDGEWGLRTFESKPVDLVVLDVLVPKIVGFDLVERIRKSEHGAHVPIIVVSGVYRASVHRAKMIERFRILEYFDKPLDVDKLLYAIREVWKISDPPHSGDAPSLPPQGTPSLPEAVGADDWVGTASEPVLPRRGSLDRTPFARLLGALYAHRASGAVLLKRSAVKKIVYVVDGVPVFVKSNLISECLGRVMVRERIISERECDASVERLKRERRRQGEILIEMNAISPHNLRFGLEQQMETKLFDIFSWREGQFMLDPEQRWTGPESALTMSPTETVYEGVRRTMAPDRVFEELERIQDLKLAPSEDRTFRYQALQLEPRAEGLLDRIDGSSTVREVLDASSLGRTEAAMLLYAMTNTGLVSVLRTRAQIEAAEQAQSDRPSADPAKRLARTQKTSGPPPIHVVDEADLEPLEGGASARDPAMAAIAAARKKARAAAEEALRSASDALKHEAARTPRVRTTEGLKIAAPERGAEARPSDPTPQAPTVPEGIRPVAVAADEAVVAAVDEAPPGAELAASPAPEPRAEAAPIESPPAEGRDAEPLEVPPLAEDEPDAAAAPLPTPEPAEPSSPPTAPRLDIEREHARTLKSLEDVITRLERKNHYERLGVHRNAGRDEIDRAFRKLSREHHPDRVVPGPSTREVRARAERAFLLLRRAWEALSHDEERRDYDRALGHPDPLQGTGLAQRAGAEAAFERGVAFTEEGDWDAAVVEFERASEHGPEEGAYLAYLAWSSFCASPDRRDVADRALEELEAALGRDRGLEDAWVFRGLIQEKLGERDAAIDSLRRAVDVNPDCVRALRALRTLAPPERRSGFLARFGVGD